MPWNPDRYHQFQSQRALPFEDTLRLVKVRDGLKVIDLGCGTGELTRKLADALPNSEVLGMDSSAEMLSRAAEHVRPGLRFEQGRIEQISDDWDLIFSHAALQWVDDHPALMARLFGHLRPGGQLVVQMPSNHTHRTHALITDIAQREPFATKLNHWVRQSPVMGIDQYADLLYQIDGEDITVFEKIYGHLLENADALVDWTTGTALVPYSERLGPELYEQFLQIYRERMRIYFPFSPVFYGFRRTLFAVMRPS